MSPLHKMPRRVLITQLLPATVLLALLSLSGCSPASSILSPASKGARDIAGLFWMVMAVAAVIFVGVEGLLIYSLFRFRHRPGQTEPRQVHGNFRLEVAWTILPTVIVAGIFAATVFTMVAVAERQPEALRIKVTGHQWWWEIDYPDQGITTATDLHVPVGRPVEVELVSADVVHSFWAPELFGKTDVIPGQINRTVFTADRPGTYIGRCAEFCGTQHANMGFLIIADPPEQFEEWVSRVGKPWEPRERGEESEARAFLNGACGGCHSIKGTMAQGKMGPSLSHFGLRQTIGSLALGNTPQNLYTWLANPQAVKPGTKMPNLNLKHDTIEDIVTYLESLK
ncbi:MAG: cytochrome c oxidase subunit II [Chloroflexi bacterium]|nr:cytochrome c oxidase subunit II [Chloroflexota bacterium]